MKKRTYEFPYCLSCYAALNADLATDSVELGNKATARRNARASIACPNCESVHLVVDIQRHWTKEPKLVELEWWLKAAVVVFISAMSIAVLTIRQPGLSAAGHGMVVGAPILSAVVLWDLMSLTLKRPLFHAGILWGITLGALALAIALIASVGMGDVSATGIAIAGLITLPFAILPSQLKRVWMAWRERRIARMQKNTLAARRAARN